MDDVHVQILCSVDDDNLVRSEFIGSRIQSYFDGIKPRVSGLSQISFSYLCANTESDILPLEDNPLFNVFVGNSHDWFVKLSSAMQQRTLNRNLIIRYGIDKEKSVVMPPSGQRWSPYLLFLNEWSQDAVATAIYDFLQENTQQGTWILPEPAASEAVSSDILRKAANEIDFAVEAIADLRLNTTYEIINNLKDVSSNLRRRASETRAASKNELSDILSDLINLCGRLLDAMENKKFAGIAACGIIGSVVGLIGTPAITATAMCMAYAQGPDFFKQFLSDVLSRAGISAKADKATPPKSRRRRRR